MPVVRNCKPPLDHRQLEWLATLPGERGSGRVRYAAAMYFYQRGLLSDLALEVFRTCSVFDHEDPRPVLSRIGLSRELDTLRDRVIESVEKSS